MLKKSGIGQYLNKILLHIPLNMLLEFLRSKKGEDFRLLLDVSVALLLFFWLLKNHRILTK